MHKILKSDCEIRELVTRSVDIKMCTVALTENGDYAKTIRGDHELTDDIHTPVCPRVKLFRVQAICHKRGFHLENTTTLVRFIR